jgi:hypothetical protein
VACLPTCERRPRGKEENVNPNVRAAGCATPNHRAVAEQRDDEDGGHDDAACGDHCVPDAEADRPQAGWQARPLQVASPNAKEPVVPKRIGRRTIEHWRDGECIARIEVTEKMIQRNEDGTARVVFPPGNIVLATGDELHFDVDGLIERLKGGK